ncbi:MAG: arginine deiminase family protein [Candidatus Aminicenantes bacterium]|nr:arginine deiminase family protein [Candidatus Aminicenantes bacterium]
MFRHAIVRKPCRNLVRGISTALLGKPDYEQALRQHAAYVDALRSCGLEVVVLEADESYPDSTFVEDTAVVTEKIAVISNPGAPSRRGEEGSIAEALKSFFSSLEYIKPPGTLEGGDVMRAGDHFYIGLSQRTNREGANQLVQILEKSGYAASLVPLEHVLHLKTGVVYLENKKLLAAGEFIAHPVFKEYHLIPAAVDELYAANSLWVNGWVLVPAGFNKTRRAIENLGYSVKTVDVSEFRKLDGGLSCLSLRF